MSNLVSLRDADKVLAQYTRPTGLTKGYKLDSMLGFMEYIGNPQNDYRVIHVAGTSGKSSTCYYIAEILKQAGHKVGLTVSPHVDAINERAQINTRPLPEKEYCRKLSEFLAIVDASPYQLSYFEVLVAFAYWLFAQQKVEYAVVEVGLGGLLDGTNVIDRSDKVCVITDIGYDHVEVLGDRIERIAAQKAGIIHAQNTVFIHEQSQEVLDVVHAVCRQEKAALHVVPQHQNSVSKGLPEFQQRNFNVAKAVTYSILDERKEVLGTKQLQDAAAVHIPARMEIVQYKKKSVILDGSHNVQKIHALAGSIKGQFPDTSRLVVLSLGNNKQSEAEGVLAELREISDEIVLTTFQVFQDEARYPIEPKYLANICRKLGFSSITIMTTPIEAFEYACSTSCDQVIVAGSYFLLNDIRPHIVKR